MKARIEITIRSETDLEVMDIVDLMNDALQRTHNIVIEGIVVDKEESAPQLLNEKKTEDPKKVEEPKKDEGVKVTPEDLRKQKLVEDEGDNKPVKTAYRKVPSSITDTDPSKHKWDFGTHWF